RFDAISREYKYYIFRNKNPFLQDRAFYYPYPLDIDKLNDAAKLLMIYKDFTSFSKRNTQVKDFICDIKKSEWIKEKETLVYSVEANRFLRGMVKGIVGTILRVGTGKMTLNEFEDIIQNRNCTKADFSVDSKGLFLVSVNY
ncbi:MAG: tRNA pseudouridine(38-40) synthase TruA, partial [Ginsengibacter sp.]